MEGGEPQEAGAGPVAPEAPAAPAPTAATEFAPPQPDLEAAEASPPPPSPPQPASRGWRARFGRKKDVAAGEEDAAAAAAHAAPVAPGESAARASAEGLAPALPPSADAPEAGGEALGVMQEVPPRKWPTWDRFFFYGWDSRPGLRADPAAAAEAGAAGAAGAAAAGGVGAWFAWGSLGGQAVPRPQPEPWCKDYVKLGRWASLVFTTWQELCFTAGVHPFTGGSTDPEVPSDAKTPTATPKARAAAASGQHAGEHATPAGRGSGAAPGARAQLQRCFLQACSSAQDQLTRETAGLMVVAVLLAVAAAGLIGSLSLKGDWGGGDYASYVLLLLSAACSLTHLAIGACVYLAAAGRPPRSFFRLLLSFEPLARAGVASFFAALTFLFAGVLAFAFYAAWMRRDAIGNGAAAAQVSVLFLALAAIYYLPSYIAGRWMLRCQDKSEGRSRVVSKAALLSSLEPLLAWSFAEHTVPPAFRTRAGQAGHWEPLRRYCEAHSFDIYREFELLPAWQAWALRCANLLLSALGPPSLLRLRPTGSPFNFEALGPSTRTAGNGAENKAAAAIEEEEAAGGGGLEVPRSFTVHLEE